MVRFRTAVAVSLFAVALGSMRGDAQQPQQQPAQPPSQTPPGDQPPAGQPPPVFRAGINFVRVDVIVTDKTGAAVTNLEATDFEITEEGKPQQIETFKFDPARWRPDARSRRPAASDSHGLRRRVGGGPRRRAAVRGVPRRLSCARRQQPGRPRADRAIHRDAARPLRHGGLDVSAPAGGGGTILAESQRDPEGHPGLSRPQIRLHASERVTRSGTRTTRPRSSNASATRCRCRRSRRSSAAWAG